MNIEYLRKKGAMELLIEIGEDPQRHTDLREKLLLSSSTLQKRLKRGSQLGFWEQTIQEHENGLASKVWQLTEDGQKVYRAALSHNVDQYHEARRNAAHNAQKAENQTLNALYSMNERKP